MKIRFRYRKLISVSSFFNAEIYAANKDRKNLGTAWKWGLDYLEQWPKRLNPILSIKKFPEKREPRYVPPEEDFWKVFELTSGQDRVMLLTFLHLAARRSEVFHLKWSDVDFSSKRIRLWTQKREGGNQECDWLPMTTELRSVLLKWWEERLAQTTADKDHVFLCLMNFSSVKSITANLSSIINT